MYDSLDALQADLGLWMEYYNNDRPHSGRYCYGKTPIETFIDAIPLAKEKNVISTLPAYKPWNLENNSFVRLSFDYYT